MTHRPTTPDPELSSTAGDVEPVPRRRIWLALVAIALILQIAVAAVALTEPRASRYGWQMYAAVPFIPAVWATTDGHEEPVDLRSILIHPRIEIDYVALIRERGCELTGADSVRFEVVDGTWETVGCG